MATQGGIGDVFPVRSAMSFPWNLGSWSQPLSLSLLVISRVVISRYYKRERPAVGALEHRTVPGNGDMLGPMS
jgi:hypothetical protein